VPADAGAGRAVGRSGPSGSLPADQHRRQATWPVRVRDVNER